MECSSAVFANFSRRGAPAATSSSISRFNASARARSFTKTWDAVAVGPNTIDPKDLYAKTPKEMRKKPIEPYVRSTVSVSAISARGGSARAGMATARLREDDAHRSTFVERDGEATARRTGRAVERVVDRAVRARVVGVTVVAVRDVAIVVSRRVKARRVR